MIKCPSPETLGRLAHDSSMLTHSAAVEAHVETCADCQRVLEQMAANTFASEGTGPERLPPLDQPPTIPGFVIERELGRGGMGVVYQAWQPQLARRVAIKVVVGAGIRDAGRSRWLDEARAIARLRHRNVVQIHQADEQAGCLYLVLDLIPGGSLAERARGPLPARVAATLLATVARTVHDLHQAGIVHLDLKPSNILLDGPPDGRWDQLTPMVTDFGISRTSVDLNVAPSVRSGVGGTLLYMAPEQSVGDRARVGPLADVYALGATLYCLLTGRPPFQAASPRETLALVQGSEPAPPTALVPGVPRDLETIALTCLNKDQHRRYVSAGALADDLQRWLDGFPIRARPVSTFEHASRWCRRRPGVAALFAVLTLTVTLSLVGLFLLWRQSENALTRAVESDKAASVAIGDLLGLLTETADEPQEFTSERLEKASRVVRDLMTKLLRDRELSASNVVAICDLTQVLANDFLRRGNHSEERVLLMETVRLVEEVKKRTGDPRIEKAHANLLLELARDLNYQERFDEALVFLRRADEILEAQVKKTGRLDAIETLDNVRAAIAEAFRKHGEIDVRRTFLESHLQLLDRLSRHAGADPEIGLLAELTRQNLAPDSDASAKLRIWLQRFPNNPPIPTYLVSRLALWVTRDINPYPPVPDTSTPVDPEAHAVDLMHKVESRCNALGADKALFLKAALEVVMAGVQRGSEERNARRLDKARQTAACLFAFAEMLMRRNPDDGSSHIVMYEAHVQNSKLAWQIKDYALIETAWRKALEEAGIALRLDPKSAEARVRIATLREKLIELSVGRAAATP